MQNGKFKRTVTTAVALIAVISIMLVLAGTLLAAPLSSINLSVGEANTPQEVSSSIQILLLLTVLSLAPAMMIMMTAFTRIVIVLGFIRNAIGTAQMPPNQVIIAIALFLTFFVMAPTFKQVNDKALAPYMKGSIKQDVAISRGEQPIREFMFTQLRGREKDLALFISISKLPRPKTKADVPTYVLIPAFIINELKIAFTIGFMIYIPFLIIDMVVASTLLSMGMMMLPPVMISLPFKILLFVLVDGWHLITRSLLLSFR